MAKKMWQWTDGCSVHKGYSTKRDAEKAWREHFDANRAVLSADHSWEYKVSSYHEKHTVTGYVGRYSLPSRGEHSLHAPNGIYAQIKGRAGMTGRDKPDSKQLRRRYTCDSCGAPVDLVVRYSDFSTFDYYGCPDATCTEPAPASHVAHIK